MHTVKAMEPQNLVNFKYHNELIFFRDCKIQYKILGVILTESLFWTEHVEYIHRKVCKARGIISKTRFMFSARVRLLLYYSLIYTHYVYCHLVWVRQRNKT